MDPEKKKRLEDAGLEVFDTHEEMLNRIWPVPPESEIVEAPKDKREGYGTLNPLWPYCDTCKRSHAPYIRCVWPEPPSIWKRLFGNTPLKPF